MSSERERIFSQLLAIRCRRGERDAWRELVALWEPRVFYYVRRIVPQESDAWDVLQQTWLGAYQSIGSLTDPRMLPAWLYRIARNKAINHRRKRGMLVRELSDLIDEPPADDAGDALEAFDDAEAVHRALDELSLSHREVLVLHFLQDLSLEQIAGVLDVPVGTVKSRLHHAKRGLRNVLEKEASS